MSATTPPMMMPRTFSIRDDQENRLFDGNPLGFINPALARFPSHAFRSVSERIPEPRLPAHTFFEVEGLHIRQITILIALQDDTFTARHFRQFINGEDQHLTVGTDNCDVVRVVRNNTDRRCSSLDPH